MTDDRWIQLADWGSQLVWSLIDTFRYWFSHNIRLFIAVILLGVAVVIIGYAIGEFYAHPPKEE